MSEALLVDDFTLQLTSLQSPFSVKYIGHEFNYRSGVTDIIAQLNSGEICAFEAKLFKWRDALHQAYRNLSFAHFSYVLLPAEISKRAMKYIHEFELRGVGLCTFDGTSIEVLFSSKQHKPILPWLTSRAEQHLVG